MGEKTMSSKSRVMTSLAFALAMCLGSVFAIDDTTGYVVLNTTDGAGQTSWNTGTRWSSGQKPESGFKYLVNSAIQLRSPESVFTTPFKGDSLTLDNGASLFLKSYNGTLLSANWILYNASIAGGGLADSITTTIAGSMEVHGTSTTPTKINATANDCCIKVDAALSGGCDAFLSLLAKSTSRSGRIVISGNNSAYCGRLEFKSNDSSAGYNYLKFAGSTSVGVSGDPSAGEPFLSIPDGNHKPIVELENVEMDSRFTIECDNSNARIDLIGTNVLFAAALSGSASGIPVNVAEGLRLLARLNADGTSTASAFSEGMILNLSGDKIPIRLDGVLPLTNSMFSATLLTIPTSVRSVTPADIDLDADDFGLMERTITVDTVNGIQTVSVTFTGSVVYYSVYNASAAFDQGAQYWSDNRIVHGDADYLINYDVPAECNSLRGSTQRFAGRSLTFARGGVLIPKGTQTAPGEIDNLRMLPGSKVSPVNTPIYLAGGLTAVGSRVDDPVVFTTDATRTLYLQSSLSGEGPVRFVSNVGGVNFSVILSGRSEAFTGTMEFYGANAGRRNTVTIYDETNFGGNPPDFNAAQTWFHGPVTLKVANDVVIDNANRGITFDMTTKTAEIPNPTSELNVPAGATLTLNVPMVVNANLVKTGAGTLGVGGSITGTASNLTVSAGNIMPVTRQASSALRYTMSAGTGLVLALDSEDGDVAVDGLYVKDAAHLTLAGAMPVTIKGSLDRSRGTVRVGIANVPSDMANAVEAAIGSTVTFENSATGKARPFPVMRETIAGGRVKFYADVFVPGLTLIVL